MSAEILLHVAALESRIHRYSVENSMNKSLDTLLLAAWREKDAIGEEELVIGEAAGVEAVVVVVVVA